MQGNEQVIAHLNEVLKAELTAINQYFLHAEMMENWGYIKLANYTKKESIDEMRHAEAVTRRLDPPAGMRPLDVQPIGVLLLVPARA